MDTNIKRKYIQILREELIPAEGCTEPIALALCAAKAKETLSKMPEKIIVYASGNIIKNTKSVTVPNTNGKKGIEAAVIYGAAAGCADRKLEVLQDIDIEKSKIAEGLFSAPGYVEVRHLASDSALHIIVEVSAEEQTALVEIKDEHTNIIRIEKNGKAIFRKDEAPRESADNSLDRSFMELKGIIEFAENVPLDEVKEIIELQIKCNMRIAKEGLSGDYGVNTGKLLLASYDNDVRIRCAAEAAAGSDARMGGAEFPVVINSGSGNQGMTVSIPVIEYARSMDADDNQLIRALIISNLTAVYQKRGIGRLSAYCGAVSAAGAAIAGIAWLDGSSYEVISHTITNTLGSISGMICDGAKASCAVKIAAALNTAFMGYELARHHQVFRDGEGIVKKDVDKTIDAVGMMASRGMMQTDEEIVRIMINN